MPKLKIFLLNHRGLIFNLFAFIILLVVTPLISKVAYKAFVPESTYRNIPLGLILLLVSIADLVGHDVKIRSIHEMYQPVHTRTKQVLFFLVWILRLMWTCMTYIAAIRLMGFDWNAKNNHPALLVLVCLGVIVVFFIVSIQVFLQTSGEEESMFKKVKSFWGDTLLFFTIPMMMSLINLGNFHFRREIFLSITFLVIFLIIPLRWVYIWEEYEQHDTWWQKILVAVTSYINGVIVFLPQILKLF